MNGIENRLVSANGREIRYCLERKDVKNLNLRVLKDGRVFVSANSTVPSDEIDRFVCRKARYIMDAIDRFRDMLIPFKCASACGTCTLL